MKTNKTNHARRQTRPTLARPAPPPQERPPAPRPGCEFLDFCFYPGMKPMETALAYPTAV